MFQRKVSFWGLAIALLCVGAANAQTIQIVGGNGQLVRAQFQAGELLKVLVKDAAGKPLPNQTVAWALTNPAQGGGLSDTTTVTDANGIASVTLSGQGIFFSLFTSYVQINVTATLANGASVTFLETISLRDPQSSADLVSVSLVSLPDVLTGGVGTQATSSIQIFVRPLQTSGGIPGVSLRLTTDSATGPQISCAGGDPPGTVYTDQSGIATCTPVFMGSVGTAVATIVVGGGFTTFQKEFTVTIGPPGLIRILQGDNQSGPAGQLLPVPLLASIADLSGNLLGGIAVTFEPVVAGTATISNIRSPSGVDGRVSAQVTLGNAPGPVQVRVRTLDGSNVSTVFNLTAVLAFTSMTKVSGDPQDAPVNTTFTQPLIVQIMNQGQPAVNVPVQFAVTSGSALVGTPPSVTSVTVNTDAAGRASTNVQAGSATGTVVITATAGTFNQTFTLTVRPAGPTLSTNSFFSAAGGQQLSGLAPCSLVTIAAAGIAPGIRGAVVAPEALFFGPLPFQLANVIVQVGSNNYAPIFNVANIDGQESVTIQVPCNQRPGVSPVTVTVNGVPATVNVPIVAYTPGIFQTVMSDGRRRAVLLRPDGSYVTLQNPARAGEIMRMYAAGLGNPGTIDTNQPGLDDQPLNIPVIVGVNNQGVRVVSVKLARNLIGVYEVAFELPTDVGTGDNVPFAIAVTPEGGGAIFGNPSAIVIR